MRVTKQKDHDKKDSPEIRTPVLCYVAGNWAYFTTKPLGKQWGDDWDNAYYGLNSEPPSGPCWHNDPEFLHDPNVKRGCKPGTQVPLAPGELCRCEFCQEDWNADGTPSYAIFKIAWDGPWLLPLEEFRVQEINKGLTPWLRPDSRRSHENEHGIMHDAMRDIMAGTPLPDFIAAIAQSGGRIYLPLHHPLPPTTTPKKDFSLRPVSDIE